MCRDADFLCLRNWRLDPSVFCSGIRADNRYKTPVWAQMEIFMLKAACIAKNKDRYITSGQVRGKQSSESGQKLYRAKSGTWVPAQAETWEGKIASAVRAAALGQEPGPQRITKRKHIGMRSIGLIAGFSLIRCACDGRGRGGWQRKQRKSRWKPLGWPRQSSRGRLWTCGFHGVTRWGIRRAACAGHTD